MRTFQNHCRTNLTHNIQKLVLDRLKGHIIRKGFTFRSNLGADNPVALVWHGFSNALSVGSVRAAGLKDLRSCDAGFFGAGIYAALEALYARCYAEKLPLVRTSDGTELQDVRVVALCFGAVGSAYPVTRAADYPQPDAMQSCSRLLGKALQVGYDSHFAAVGRHFQAASEREIASGEVLHEVVFKESPQVLPAYLIYFKADKRAKPLWPGCNC